MKKNEWIMLIAVVIVVSIAANLITTNITGNIINVGLNKKGPQVYTVNEINGMIDNTDASEAYLLDVTSISEETAIKKNYTSLKNVVTGETICSSKTTGDVCYIGSLEIKFGVINKDEKTVELIATRATTNLTTGAGQPYIQIMPDTKWRPFDLDTDKYFLIALKK